MCINNTFSICEARYWIKLSNFERRLTSDFPNVYCLMQHRNGVMFLGCPAIVQCFISKDTNVDSICSYTVKGDTLIFFWVVLWQYWSSYPTNIQFIPLLFDILFFILPMLKFAWENFPRICNAAHISCILNFQAISLRSVWQSSDIASRHDEVSVGKYITTLLFFFAMRSEANVLI